MRLLEAFKHMMEEANNKFGLTAVFIRGLIKV